MLLVQAVALPGALGVGWLTTRFGRRPATAICLGGAQSLLRAAVAALAPAGHAGVAFGLLQVGTKLAGFTAGLAFGALLLATGVPQAGLIALIAQLVAAWWMLRRAV